MKIVISSLIVAYDDDGDGDGTGGDDNSDVAQSVERNELVCQFVCFEARLFVFNV